jgi:hypothetical protein
MVQEVICKFKIEEVPGRLRTKKFYFFEKRLIELRIRIEKVS